jgi:hypothetical protein
LKRSCPSQYCGSSIADSNQQSRQVEYDRLTASLVWARTLGCPVNSTYLAPTCLQGNSRIKLDASTAG